MSFFIGLTFCFLIGNVNWNFILTCHCGAEINTSRCFFMSNYVTNDFTFFSGFC